MKKFQALLIVLVFLLANELFSQNQKLGVDLSYVNQLEDCGAQYFENQQEKDVYSIFSSHNCQVVRLRLWHNPGWTDYSTFNDVKKSIQRAKNQNMEVLLDFHYSDEWADPSKQHRPKAWKDISEISVLSDSVYNYTFNTLNKLKKDDLLPEYVQIGNETNGNILLLEGEELYPVNWSRNKQLFEAGIQAAKAVDTTIKTMLHVADPTNGDWWFSEAINIGLTSFDIIGLSYYPQWHDINVEGVGTVVESLSNKFEKPVWIVETGYPWTLENNGDAGNILGEASVLPGYANPPSVVSQKNFLINLTYQVIENGGMGIIYWEPAWVTSSCSTQWGEGSHYENAAFFDFDNHLHEGIDFLSYDYSNPPQFEANVTFYVDMTGVDITESVYVTGDFTGTNWQFMEMQHIGGNIYKYETTLQKGDEGAYIFTVKADWDMEAYHEHVPEPCAEFWDTHRKYSIQNEVEIYAYPWESCEELVVSASSKETVQPIGVYPNPFNQYLNINTPNNQDWTVHVYSINGKRKGIYPSGKQIIDGTSWSEGIYIIELKDSNLHIVDSVKILKTM